MIGRVVAVTKDVVTAARVLPVVAVVALVVLVLTVVAAGPSPAAAQEQNPIQIENARPGTTGWRLSKPSDDLNKQIKGYGDKASVNTGESIDFHVSVNRSQTFTIEVYRLGYYGGTGARLMRSIGPLNGSPQTYPPFDPTTGYLEYNWPVAHRLTIPNDWVSGIYLAKLRNADGYDNYIGFVVRNDQRQAALLFQRPILTDHAYNSFPNVDPSTPGFDGSNPAHVGKSLYEFNSGGGNTVVGTTRAVRVSMDRPMSGNGVGLLFTWEYDLVQWLERTGYDVTYSTNIETHVNPSRLLDFKGFISPAHDEYWTGEMFTAVERARDAGVGLAFMGANAAYYQVRLEPSLDGTPRRSIVTYKSAALDPEPDRAKKTGRFRDIGRPEQGLVGIQYVDYGPPVGSAFVPRNIDHWLYEGTGITATDVIPGVVGSEIDIYDPQFPLPSNRRYTLLAASPYVGARGQYVQNASIYQAPSGAWVFASGTLSWSMGLGRPGVTSPVIQRMTKNLFDRFLVGGSGNDPGGVTILVRLRGSTGEERARLYTDNGQTVLEQVVPNQWTTISTTVPTVARELYVGFVNDASTALGDRNLRVDSLTWTGAGSTVQAESVESKGVWNGTDCGQGFRNSETLACNGWFKFAVPGNVTPPPPPPGGQEITVTLRGTTGTEAVGLEIDGQVVRQWTASTTNATTAYTHNGSPAGTVRVVFTNDGRDGAGRDRNVVVESVGVGGQTFDPIDVRSRGVWNGVDCGEGFRQSRFLACNGWFEFIVGTSPRPADRFNVRLRGTTGSELTSISVDGTDFGPYQVPSDWTEIGLPLTAGSITTIRVNFLNDAIVNGQDRNLIVDWLSLDGQRFEAETLVAKGVWDGSRCDVEKVHGTGYLACRGWVELRPG